VQSLSGRHSLPYAKRGCYPHEMDTSQILMGGLVALLCLYGLWRHRWFFENTRKGRRLAQWFGETGGLRVLVGLLLVGMVFGLLLATDVIRPIHWAKP
jgi:hypothetical protein